MKSLWDVTAPTGPTLRVAGGNVEIELVDVEVEVDGEIYHVTCRRYWCDGQIIRVLGAEGELILRPTQGVPGVH